MLLVDNYDASPTTSRTCSASSAPRSWCGETTRSTPTRRSACALAPRRLARPRAARATPVRPGRDRRAARAATYRRSASASGTRRSSRPSAARSAPARELVHGKASDVAARRRGLFRGLPAGFQAGRYHSLAATRIPDELEISRDRTGRRGDGRPPPRAARPRRPVPPRVGADADRARPRQELPGGHVMQDTLARLLDGHDLSRAEARARRWTRSCAARRRRRQIGGFLVALRLKGETAEEIAGCAEAMREHVLPVDPQREDLVDTAGTGGDGGRTFNISTAAALVAAAAGAGVAKHGNRAVSSASGSADVLEALGFRLELEPERIARVDRRARLRLPVRADPPSGDAPRGARPARAGGPHGLQRARAADEPGRRARSGGRASTRPSWCRTIAEVLALLGARRAFVVHGAEGIDELSPAGPNLVCEVVDGEVRRARDRPAGARHPPLRARGAARRRAGGQRARDPRGLRRRRTAAGATRCCSTRPARSPRADTRATCADGLGLARGGGRRRARPASGWRRSSPSRRPRWWPDGPLPGRAGRARASAAIAEVKRRSPSAGDLRPDADPAALAAGVRARRRGRGLGARRRALRRLDRRSARGSRRDGAAAAREGVLLDPASELRGAARGRCRRRAAAPARSRRRGGDASCCGAAARARARRARGGPRRRRARRAPFGSARTTIGINARDLSTFGIDRRAQLELVAKAPRDRVVVAESGIASRAQGAAAELAGADAILVGSTLMRAERPAREARRAARPGRS